MNRQPPDADSRSAGPSRRSLLGAGAGLGLGLGAGPALAGCSGSNPGSGSDSASGSGAGSDFRGRSSRSATAATAPPSVGPAPSPRTVSTVMGKVTVPARPSRIVTLDTAELDSVRTLGLTPVGACRAAPDSGLLDYWASDRLSPIRTTGTIGDPDLKAVAELQPDLILSNKLRDGSRYRQLSEIAPTVFTESTGYPWKSNFRLHAAALGLGDSADVVLDAYAAHVTNVIDALGGKGKAGAHKVGVVRFVAGGPIRLYGRRSFVGSVLADVQVGRPGSQNTDVFAVDIGPTQIQQTADATTLVYASYGPPGRSRLDAVTSGSRWKALPAVREHQDARVDDQLWFLGIGYTGANELLSQLQYLLGG